MKIVMNTNYKSAGVQICMDETAPKFISAGHEVKRNDWENYQNYELILFMPQDSQVQKAKKINPAAVTGIIYPTLTKARIKEFQSADFLVVSSIEHRDFMQKYNKNIFIYYSFQDVREIKKEHYQKDKIIIGYHGNQSHLICMKHIVSALDNLSNKYDIELWPVYNMEKWGKWRKGLPKKTPVKHIQWTENSYLDILSQTDVGIVPSGMPINETMGKIITSLYLKRIAGYKFKYNKLDYLMRFKYSTNPGRIYAFSQLGIPVVADFTPSNCQIIKDGESGFLAWSKEGWYDSLEKLILSAELRNKMSQNLRNYINSNCSPDSNFKNFLDFLGSLKK